MIRNKVLFFCFIVTAFLLLNNVLVCQVNVKPAQPPAGNTGDTASKTKTPPSIIDVNAQLNDKLKPHSNDHLGIYINRTSIRVLGGIAKSIFEQENTTTTSNKLYNAEIDLGLADIIEFDPNEAWYMIRDSNVAKPDITKYRHLSKYDFSGLSFSFVDQLNDPSINSSNMTQMWSIGLSGLEGYGYKFKNGLSLKFIAGTAPMWSWMSVVIMGDGSPTSNEVHPDFAIFGDNVRFGKKYQSEISLQMNKHISVFANANRTLVYPRTLFWKMAGNGVVFAIAEGVLGMFTNSIKKNGSNYYPIVDFILRSGLYFGMSELQKSKSHFPFKSVSPLSVDHFRLGLQFDL